MADETSGAGLDATLRDFSAGQKVFQRYTLIRTLGRGGMGVVWLAHDEVLDRDVALKFLPEIIIHDRALLEDLKRETKRSLELTHKNIIRIHDFVHDMISGCISMEYVEGDTLSNLRADKPAKIFEPDEIKPWLSQLCDALDYAHNHARIVHRDLKPSNLMVSKRGYLKVADFGIARSLSDSVSMLTMQRGTSGTLVYMSPQQLDGERGTHLDDIYSLGATIYELLTSKPPFYSGNIDRQIHDKIPPSMTDRRRDFDIQGDPIPKNWEETIAACLAKDPVRRPQSIADIAGRLQLLSPPMPAKPAKKALVAALTVAATVITILATIIVGARLRRHEPSAQQPKQTQQTPPAPTPTSKLEETERAAGRGEAEAQANLAILYQTGVGVPKDLAKAADLYNLAAAQGNAVAQNNLGRMYDKGIGVEKDLKKAVALYEKAANQGNADAQNNLAFLYWNGVGVPRDLSKAMALYRQAADQGNTYAQQELGTLPRETEEGADRFARMFGKAENQGQGELYAQLGALYENGAGLPKDLRKAAELYQKAAENGNESAKEQVRRLEQSESAAPGTKNIPQGSSLGITDVMASESPDPNVDTKLTLRIVTRKLPSQIIEPTEARIQVFFYDTVGNGDIKLTNADVTYEWITPPSPVSSHHDWANIDNTEILAVKYAGPKNKGAADKSKSSEYRRYFGYIVRVYYGNQLQDKRADPTKLLDLFPAPTSLATSAPATASASTPNLTEPPANIIQKFVESLGENNPDAQLQFYSDKVAYYEMGNVTKDTVRRDLEHDIRTWSSRVYSIRETPKIIRLPSGAYQAEFPMTYTLTNAKGSSSGIVEMTVRFQSEGQTWKIFEIQKKPIVAQKKS